MKIAKFIGKIALAATALAALVIGIFVIVDNNKTEFATLNINNTL